MEEILNERYIFIINEMRKLNKERYEIFNEFKKLNPSTEPIIIRTPSLYHDLYNIDLDEL